MLRLRIQELCSWQRPAISVHGIFWYKYWVSPTKQVERSVYEWKSSISDSISAWRWYHRYILLQNKVLHNRRVICIIWALYIVETSKQVQHRNRYTAGQGRRQEFFQGRAPSHFSNSRGGGAQPRVLIGSMVKMKEFSGQGNHDPPLPMPAYAYAGRNCHLKWQTYCCSLYKHIYNILLVWQ